MSLTYGKIYNPYTMTWENPSDFFSFMEKRKMTEQNQEQNQEPKPETETTSDEDTMQEMVDNEAEETTEGDEDEESEEDTK